MKYSNLNVEKSCNATSRYPYVDTVYDTTMYPPLYLFFFSAHRETTAHYGCLIIPLHHPVPKGVMLRLIIYVISENNL